MNTMLQSFTFLAARVAPVLLAMLAALVPVHAQPLPPLAALPGDTQRVPATQVQERPDVAPGGEGYLVVWHDARSALKPLTNNLGSGPDFTTLGGNMRDVYAARLDADGNLLDTTPMILANDGYNQARPRVAWNGQHWLVVWLDDQDDYDTNIVGVRVSPDGTVLDNPPLLIRQQANNSGPGDPVIASDGSNWLVVWPEFVDQVRGLRGARVAPDGSVLDNPPKILRLDSYNSYADAPDIDFANAQYVVTWIEDSGELDARRFATDLTPIDAAPIAINGAVAPYSVAKFPRVASNGSTTLFVWWEDRYFGFSQAFAARMAANGTVLDPAGIELTAYADYTNFVPAVAWDGTRWFVSFNKDTGNFEDDLFVARVAADGSVLDFGGVPVGAGPDRASESALTARPGGGVQVAWTESDRLRPRHPRSAGGRGRASGCDPGSVDRPASAVAAALREHGRGASGRVSEQDLRHGASARPARRRLGQRARRGADRRAQHSPRFHLPSRHRLERRALPRRVADVRQPRHDRGQAARGGWHTDRRATADADARARNAGGSGAGRDLPRRGFAPDRLPRARALHPDGARARERRRRARPGARARRRGVLRWTHGSSRWVDGGSWPGKCRHGTTSRPPP